MMRNVVRQTKIGGMLVMRLMNLEIFMRKFWGNHHLKCTMEYAIKYPGPCSPDATEDEIRDRNRLWATVDASYAACSDGRGITAITISLGTMCPPVLVKNRKQGSITKSSCESEYYGYYVSGDRLNRLKEKLRDYLKKNHRAD
jgi:hypothetical protein